MKLYTNISPPIPMRAVDWTPEKAVWPCYIQPKLNGVRGLVSPDGKVYKRTGLRAPIFDGQFGAPGVWLDGELYHPETSLQKIAGYVNRRESDRFSRSIQFHAFDVVAYEPYYKRKTLLDHLPNLNDHVILVDSIIYDTSSVVNSVYENIPDHWEGLIYRDPNATYIHGNSNGLLKRKKLSTAEYKCIGAVEGIGKFDGTLGAFVVTHPNGAQFNVSAAELDDEERAALWRKPPIGEMLMVRFPYKSEEGIPQCAQFVCVRKENE